jgi:hypothetical protein
VHDLSFIYSWAKISINILSELRRIRKPKERVTQEGKSGNIYLYFLPYIHAVPACIN